MIRRNRIHVFLKGWIFLYLACCLIAGIMPAGYRTALKTNIFSEKFLSIHNKMKISYQWLKQYIHTALTPQELAGILTNVGLEVESIREIETINGGLQGVMIGEVLVCEKHPNADKLSVTTVEFGKGPVQIVCGAPNVAAGQKVVVATEGCTLYPADVPQGITIKKSKIRGVESQGMLCAEDELGLGTSHEGIMVLDASAIAGTPAKEYFGMESDYLFEIGLTPNRADAASHYGVARDLAAYLQVNDADGSAHLPEVDAFRVDNHALPVEVAVEEKEAVPRYMGVSVSGVVIGPSPEWLQKRLSAIGINPKYNVVDILNFVLHEMGQPLHAFDADKIEGGKITVKTCAEGTPFVTLDGEERKLSSEDLMICSQTRPMCIAGVFGGMDSGVTERTKNVFIESACFDPVWIRKTAKRHGLNTDASFRYERGVDPNGAPYALKRAALLIKELAGGTISSEIVDIQNKTARPFPVELSYKNITRLIGKEIDRETIKKILKGLEIEIVAETTEGLSVLVPVYRVDVRREVDVIEDILRIYGYNNVDIPSRVSASLSYAPRPDKDGLVNTASDFLSANGFTEIMGNSLTKSDYYDSLRSYPAERCVRLFNPLNNDLNVMRQTLLFNALEAVELNTNHKNADLAFYEFGNCYAYDAAAKDPCNALAPYSEALRLSLLVTGRSTAGSWNQKAEPSNFYTLKATVEKLLKRFGLDMNDGKFETLDSDLYREAVSFSIRGKRLLEMGIVNRSVQKRFDLKAEIYYAEIDFSVFIAITGSSSVSVKELPRFPEVKRDLALLVDKNITFSQLRDIAVRTERKRLKNVSLFDVYEGGKLAEGKKSYALSFLLQDPEKTLTDEVIGKTMDNLIRQFEQQAHAQVRSE